MRQVGGRRVWSLSEVTAAIWRRFEGVPSIWVEGEVRNLRPRGSQVYFTLGDEQAMDAWMNAVVFERLGVRPHDGAQVHAYGRVEFLRQRSQVRLRVERIELVGEGLLRAQIAELRGRLEAQGVLARQRGSIPLPLLPRRVGLVTSPTGAARGDFEARLEARFPGYALTLAPVPVQGESAPSAIAQAVRRLAREPGVDVIVLTRGGGSLEDLMAFNSEDVCRAVIEVSKDDLVPVVSAVGHEEDVTLCDEVADHRAATPTAAAVAVVPDREALDARMGAAEQALSRGLSRAGRTAGVALAAGGQRLGRALGGVGVEARRRLDEREARAARALRATAGLAEPRLLTAERGLERAVGARLERSAVRVGRSEELLSLLAPERTVSRGYAIVRREDGAVVAQTAAADPGTRLRVQLRDGELAAVVEGTREDPR